MKEKEKKKTKDRKEFSVERRRGRKKNFS